MHRTDGFGDLFLRTKDTSNAQERLSGIVKFGDLSGTTNTLPYRPFMNTGRGCFV